jgi:hypothetical protein
MHLSIIVDLDAAAPAAGERRAVFALAPPRGHRAPPPPPLAPFVAQLAADCLPRGPRWSTADRAGEACGAYRLLPARPRLRLNHSA